MKALLRASAILITFAIIFLIAGGIMIAAGGGREIIGQIRLPNSPQISDESELHTESLDQIDEIAIRADASNVNISVSDEVDELQIRFEAGSNIVGITRSPELKITRNDERITVSVQHEERFIMSLHSFKISALEITLPADYRGEMRFVFNACSVKSEQMSAISDIDLEANACDLRFKNLSGAFAASINACSSDFWFDQLTEDIRIDANISSADIFLPADTGASLDSDSHTMSSIYNEFDWDDGEEPSITLSGSLSAFKLKKADN